MADCCIIGGGIIGLSIARELAGRGRSVVVASREPWRETASWAAAGILPPPIDTAEATSNERLTAWSDRLHRAWAADLLAETGIDNGLRTCGGLHVCGTAAGRDRLAVDAEVWRRGGVACEWLEPADVATLEPACGDAVVRGLIAAGVVLPAETQIRPPRHLAALEASCRRRGVAIRWATTVREFEVVQGRIERVVVERDGVVEAIVAGAYVVAAGAWSGGLANAIGVAVETRPIRGQIVQLRMRKPWLSRVVNRGLDYLVPRDDGTLLAGSTLEDAGFAAVTDDAALARLTADARDLLGDGVDPVPERSWAGLRPGTADGLPTIGAAPTCRNAFVATGHFRAGLHQSTGTAVVIADLVEGLRPAIDVSAFAADRPARPPSGDAVSAMLASVRRDA